MAANIKTDLKASSRHFQHLLSSVPKQHVYDEDTIAKLDQEPSNMEATSLDDPEQRRQLLKEKLQKKLEQLRAKRKNELEDFKQRRITDKEKRKRKRKMKKEKKSLEKNREKSAKTNTSELAGASNKSNKEENVIFSKIELTDLLLAKKKKKRGLPTGKNYKMMLQKVEKQKEKLQKLEVTDKEAAKATKDKLLWKKAIAKAEGVKVKDDEACLKLALRKKEKLKQKRKEGWNKRQQDLQMKMKKQQQKRRENIDKKKNTRQEKKIKKAHKRGRVVFND